MVCEQDMFWGLVREGRSRESEQRSRERADASSVAFAPIPPLARETPKESLLAVAGYVIKGDLTALKLFPGVFCQGLKWIEA